MFSCSRTDSRGAAWYEAEGRVAQVAESAPLGVDELEHARVRALREQDRVELLVQRRERARVEVVERLDHQLVHGAGAAEVVGGERRAASAVAAPSRMLSACMLYRYCESSTIDDVRADVALERDEPLGLELADRLAHRHDAHVELARDRAEHEPIAGGEVLVAMRSLIQW